MVNLLKAIYSIFHNGYFRNLLNIYNIFYEYVKNMIKHLLMNNPVKMINLSKKIQYFVINDSNITQPVDL